MATAFYTVDFLGGPFDGYEYVISKPPSREELTIPIAPSCEADGNWCTLVTAAKPTSIAHYQLGEVRGGWTYRFVGAEAPSGNWVRGGKPPSAK